MVGVAKTTRQLVHYTDDITGEDFAEGEGRTVSFAYEGIAYDIDLSTANADELATLFGSYVEHARKATGGAGTSGRSRRGAGQRSTSSSGTAVSGSVDTAAVRAWAKGQGMAVSDRGPVSATVLEAYAAAH